MCLESSYRIAPNWPQIGKKYNEITICRHDVIIKFFYVAFFLLSSLVTRPNFMLISSLVLELWQLSFIRNWPKIRKLEIPLSEFFPISGDWGNSGTPTLERMSLIKCYWILQNDRVITFTISVLLRENQPD